MANQIYALQGIARHKGENWVATDESECCLCEMRAITFRGRVHE